MHEPTSPLRHVADGDGVLFLSRHPETTPPPRSGPDGLDRLIGLYAGWAGASLAMIGLICVVAVSL